MNLDETLIENLKKINKKKIKQEIEIISKNGNCYKLNTYKTSGNYFIDVKRQSGYDGKYYHAQGSNYIAQRKELYRNLENWIFYYYDM